MLFSGTSSSDLSSPLLPELPAQTSHERTSNGIESGKPKLRAPLSLVHLAREGDEAALRTRLMEFVSHPDHRRYKLACEDFARCAAQPPLSQGVVRAHHDHPDPPLLRRRNPALCSLSTQVCRPIKHRAFVGIDGAQGCGSATPRVGEVVVGGQCKKHRNRDWPRACGRSSTSVPFSRSFRLFFRKNVSPARSSDSADFADSSSSYAVHPLIGSMGMWSSVPDDPPGQQVALVAELRRTGHVFCNEKASVLRTRWRPSQNAGEYPPY